MHELLLMCSKLIYDISSVRDMSVAIVSHEDVDRSLFHKEYFMKDGFLEKVTEYQSVTEKG